MTDTRSDWYMTGGGYEAEQEMRAGIARTRIGDVQYLHRHAHAEPCAGRCEAVDRSKP